MLVSSCGLLVKRDWLLGSSGQKPAGNHYYCWKNISPLHRMVDRDIHTITRGACMQTHIGHMECHIDTHTSQNRGTEATLQKICLSMQTAHPWETSICKRMCSLIQVRTNTTFQHVRHIKAHIFTSFYNAYIVLITHISLTCHKSICYLAPLNGKLALWTKCPCGYKWNSFGCKTSNEPVISAVCSSCLRQYVKIFRMFLF